MRFEQSRVLDTAIFKNLPLPLFQCTVINTVPSSPLHLSNYYRILFEQMLVILT
jgi:hypothetical protein